MKQRFIDFLKIVIPFAICASILIFLHDSKGHYTAAQETYEVTHAPPSFLYLPPEEGLWEALEYYEIHHKEIVYAQAILETGNFKSKLCIKGHNLFGITKNGKYCRYNHWSESVLAYKTKIQDRYKEGENYYHFLKRIRYAEARDYDVKLMRIVNQLKHGN
jgi:hypothetical protein